METVDAIVVGAGAVGLAIARALAAAGREVVAVEAEPVIGAHCSSRNNEVIHAGFLYPPASLRGQICRRGRDKLLSYCQDHGVRIQTVGKLMPAVDDREVEQLGLLQRQGDACGVGDLEILGPCAVAAIEPSLHCIGALYSPSTAIVDAHALMLAMQGDAEADGAVVALGTRVCGGRVESGRIVVEATADGAMPYSLACSILINAAGLGARDIALSLRTTSCAAVPKVNYCKGTFYSIAGSPPFTHLVVPFGETLAMGGAFTLDLAGRGRFGGDQEWTENVDYKVDDRRKSAVVRAVRRYWPDVDPGRLSPDYAGVRPRCWGPEDASGDWVILGPRQLGVPGLVQLFGIETPGLTACLAIGEHVLRILEEEKP